MNSNLIPEEKNQITSTDIPNSPETNQHKKLRRLLELPFPSSAEVYIQDSDDFFRFIVDTETAEFLIHTIKIFTRISKIVVKERLAEVDASGELELSLDELELDRWRCRLKETTRPELATAVYVDGELIVSVLKGSEDAVADGSEGFGNDGFGGVLGGKLS